MGKVRATYYEILGVSKDAADKAILESWRLLARMLHPDKNGGTAKAAEDFAELSCAYNVLRDPKARKKYDMAQKILTEPCPWCEGTGSTWKQKGFTIRIKSVCSNCKGAGRITQ